jgi:hypothetical protein
MKVAFFAPAANRSRRLTHSLHAAWQADWWLESRWAKLRAMHVPTSQLVLVLLIVAVVLGMIALQPRTRR